MPNYDYECLNCKNQLEVAHAVDEKIIRKCPKCKTIMKKLLTGGAFQLKGDGWPGKEIKEKGQKKHGKESE